jgi:hypothetical protein
MEPGLELSRAHWTSDDRRDWEAVIVFLTGFRSCPNEKRQAVSLGTLVELEQRTSHGSEIALSADQVGVLPGRQPT